MPFDLYTALKVISTLLPVLAIDVGQTNGPAYTPDLPPVELCRTFACRNHPAYLYFVRPSKCKKPIHHDHSFSNSRYHRHPSLGGGVVQRPQWALDARTWQEIRGLQGHGQHSVHSSRAGYVRPVGFHVFHTQALLWSSDRRGGRPLCPARVGSGRPASNSPQGLRGQRLVHLPGQCRV